MKNLYFITTLVLLGGKLHQAEAEGTLIGPANGEYGVNRRVLTKEEAFTGVKGDFGGGSTLPSPRVSPNSPYKSKPTFYLGASQKGTTGNNLEIDAGLQWEPQDLPYTDINGIARTAKPGWSVFVNSVNASNQKQQVSANGWRCGVGTPNSMVSKVEMS